MSTLYTFGRCKTPYGHINLESYMGPEYAHATFYRTDGSNEPLTMTQIGAIIAAGIGDCGQPGEYSFEEVENTTYGLNEVPCERIFVALMLLQAELFQQKYEGDDDE
jgi:hypothetical protein